MKICEKCDGTGVEWCMIGPEEPMKDVCSWCDGTGEVEDKPIKFAKDYPVTTCVPKVALDLKLKKLKRDLNELEELIKGGDNGRTDRG